MARTVQEQLDAVDAAIQEIEEGAQSVTPGNGKSYTHADLSTLYAERLRLQGALIRSNRRIGVRGGRRA